MSEEARDAIRKHDIWNSEYANFFATLEEDELETLFEHFPENGKGGKPTLEKLKVHLRLLHKVGDKDLGDILSFLDDNRYGWYGDDYLFNNVCLRFNPVHRQCKGVSPSADPEQAEAIFLAFQDIFFDQEFGAVTLYIFSYCLAAIFTSKLDIDGIRTPFFPQISCARNSALYSLILEIIGICDINKGTFDKCTQAYMRHGYCAYEQVTLYPTKKTIERDLDVLYGNRDIPVLVFGYENEGYYEHVIREVANVANRKKPLSEDDRFNVLPIFVCPEIKTVFDNVLNFDLTDLEISGEYLELIKKHRRALAAWVFNFAKNFKDNLFPEQENPHKSLDNRYRFQGEVKSQTIDMFFSSIQRNAMRVRGVRPDMPLKCADNIGFLHFFFTGFLNSIKMLTLIPSNDKVLFGEEYGGSEKDSIGELIDAYIDGAESQLATLHQKFAPVLVGVTSVDISEVDKKSRSLEKKVSKYARDIVKFYQSYGVAIRIPKVEVKKDMRFIFEIEILPGALSRLIDRFAGEVKRLTTLNYFYADTNGKPMRIVASESDLAINSLSGILESQAFAESKLEIPIALGYDIVGEQYICDLAAMPHLLIGGQTGMGKSTLLHSILMSIVCNEKSSNVNLLLIDFGASKLNYFNDVPHMVCPVIGEGETELARAALKRLVAELERRNDLLKQKEDEELAKLPHIVCIIDECHSLIDALTEGKDMGNEYMLITDLVRRGRKTNIHMILATTDATKASVKFKSGDFPSKIALRCGSFHASRAILDESGAETLVGRGDMLFKSPQEQGTMFVRCSFMPPDEIKETLTKMDFSYFDASRKFTFGDFQITRNTENEMPKVPKKTAEEISEEQLVKTILWTLGQKDIANRKIQNRVGIGFNTADKLITKMEQFGIVSEQRGKLPRVVTNKTVEEIIEMNELMTLLEKHGYGRKDIEETLAKRP